MPPPSDRIDQACSLMPSTIFGLAGVLSRRRHGRCFDRLPVEADEQLLRHTARHATAAECVGGPQSGAAAPLEDNAITLGENLGCDTSQTSGGTLAAIHASAVQAQKVRPTACLHVFQDLLNRRDVVVRSCHKMERSVLRRAIGVSVIDGDVDLLNPAIARDHFRRPTAAVPIEVEYENIGGPSTAAVRRLFRQKACNNSQRVECEPAAALRPSGVMNASSNTSDNPGGTAVKRGACHQRRCAAEGT